MSLCIHSHSIAFTVEMRPVEVLPGGVFLLKAQVENTASVSAEFAGKKIDFHKYTGNQFIALVPVEIDLPPDNYPVTIIAGDEKEVAHVTVRTHRFPTKKMTLPEEKVILSPEDLKRAETEAALLESVLARQGAPAWEGRFSRPTDTEMSGEFGVARIMNEKRTSIHKGTDFRGTEGTPVKAVNSGSVVLTEDFFFGGNTLIIDHGAGLYSIYMHLSKFNASKGERVSKEQVIGLVGSTGRATGPHLHMGVRLLGVSVNPEALFKLEL
ncbi:MAG: M23 family metallopeptidase [Nitrospirae bacterium]|nr:M23 family metallopeptidase [Nitrospirota bacterium]